MASRDGYKRQDTPSELETRTGFVKEKERCETYHRRYEKARYSEAGCTKEELEILNRCKAQNGTGTERGD